MKGLRELRQDQSGAVALIGVFACAFLFGAVYFVLGVGDAVDHREAMQDAADSGAFSLAVLHARAMNLIALLNMVKLSVAVTVTSLLAVMVAATKTIAFISASQARLITMGAAIPILTAILTSTTAEHQSIRGDADAVLRAADRAQQTLRDRLPEIAQAQVTRSVVAFGAPVQDGFSPVRPLPVRRAQPVELCTRALPFARPPALEAFDNVIPPQARQIARNEAELALMPMCLTLGAAAMELEPNTALGGEKLQLRYYVLGGPQRTRGESGVEVATWRDENDTEEDGVGFAQAEYYFDGDGAAAQQEANDLFTLGWRARFRRFRPSNLKAEIDAACAAAGGASCAGPAAAAADLAERVAH